MTPSPCQRPLIALPQHLPDSTQLTTPSDLLPSRLCYNKPTVSLDVISLVASSCGYYRGHIEPRAAHEFAVHLATQRGLAKRIQHRHPPRAQPVAPMRERHCRRPRLTPRSCTAQASYRDQGHPSGAHGRRNDPIASQFHVMRCPPVYPLFASWQWLLHTGCSLEALAMTVHERNHERGYSRCKRESRLEIRPDPMHDLFEGVCPTF